MNKTRVGIFGGTFNPPHVGHIEAARAFAREAKLDKLIIMPAFIPPHKEYRSTVSCEDRLEMCRLAFKNVDKATVSDLEIARGGKSYTYLTLEELTSPDTELFFLCGTDMMLTLDTWKRPDIIFALTNICYIRRERDPKATAEIERKAREYFDTYGARIIPIDADVIEISSSEIREKREYAHTYLTKEVAEYIAKAGLYDDIH